MFSEIMLMQCLDVSFDTATHILGAAAAKVVPPLSTALRVHRQRLECQAHLQTQLASLDRALKGGIPVGSITELVGPAGVGKTQMALMLSALVPLPQQLGGLGEDSGVVYIDTEGKFNAERLVEIAQAKAPAFFAKATSGAASSGAELVRKLIGNIQVYTVRTSAELMDILHQLNVVVPTYRTRLVVVDSVAALARQEFGHTDMVMRQDLLTQQAAILKSIAEEHSVPVVVTNQVTTRFDGQDESAALSPALGNTWAHCVNTRLLMQPVQSAKGCLSGRQLSIIKSPMVGPFRVRYKIGLSGIEYVDSEQETETHVQGGQDAIRVASCMADGDTAGAVDWQQEHSKVEARQG